MVNVEIKVRSGCSAIFKIGFVWSCVASLLTYQLRQSLKSAALRPALLRQAAVIRRLTTESATGTALSKKAEKIDVLFGFTLSTILTSAACLVIVGSCGGFF